MEPGTRRLLLFVVVRSDGIGGSPFLSACHAARYLKSDSTGHDRSALAIWQPAVVGYLRRTPKALIESSPKGSVLGGGQNHQTQLSAIGWKRWLFDGAN
jgi:hypothetical protein